MAIVMGMDQPQGHKDTDFCGFVSLWSIKRRQPDQNSSRSAN
jgi:hypothetical protein